MSTLFFSALQSPFSDQIISDPRVDWIWLDCGFNWVG